MVIAFLFFYKGLDDHNDYLRFYHGLWHLFVGIFSFYVWQCKLKENYTWMDVWCKPRISNSSYYWPYEKAE